MRAQIVINSGSLESADPLACAKNWPSDRLVRPCARGQEVEYEVVRRVLDRADFLHDDVLLPLEFVLVELAVGENVAEDVKRQRRVAAQYAGKITGAFDSGLGV